MISFTFCLKTNLSYNGKLWKDKSFIFLPFSLSPFPLLSFLFFYPTLLNLFFFCCFCKSFIPFALEELDHPNCLFPILSPLDISKPSLISSLTKVDHLPMDVTQNSTVKLADTPFLFVNTAFCKIKHHLWQPWIFSQISFSTSFLSHLSTNHYHTFVLHCHSLIPTDVYFL